MFRYYHVIRIFLKEVLSLCDKDRGVSPAVLFCCNIPASCRKISLEILEGYMELLRQIINNKILWIGVLSWFIAQIFKTINNAIINGKFSLERMYGDGGMPSGHSATVSSVALAVGLYEGFDTPLFAVACILAIIVMHDAMNVRLQAGKQAALLNVLADTFEKVTGTDLPNEEKLKELLGHTPLQVIAGCLLGLLVAYVCYLII